MHPTQTYLAAEPLPVWDATARWRLMVALASAAGLALLLTNGFLVLPFLAVVGVCGLGLGFLSLGIQARRGSVRWVALPAAGAAMPLWGVTAPLEEMPNWMQIAAHFFPPTYILEGLQALAGGAFLLSTVVAGFLLAGVYAYFAYLFYESAALR